MRIAFDMKGTMVNHNFKLNKGMGRILKALATQGHEITLWSNMSSYASDFLKDYPEFQPLVKSVESKRSKSDFKEWDRELFDLAFEDDRAQHYLAAKHFVFVDTVPNITTDDEAQLFVKNLFGRVAEEEPVMEGAD